jgi:hypothetical protein
MTNGGPPNHWPLASGLQEMTSTKFTYSTCARDPGALTCKGVQNFTPEPEVVVLKHSNSLRYELPIRVTHSTSYRCIPS